MLWVQISLFLTCFVYLTQCNVVYDGNTITEQCLKSEAIASDYNPLGKMINIGNLPVYEALANKSKKRMIIIAYDKFGLSMSNNLKQVTDLISIQNGGFRTILPDFFSRRFLDSIVSVTLTLFPDFPEWAQRVANWDSIVKPDLINIVRHYRDEGVEEFGIAGFCWGAKAVTLSAIHLSDYFRAGALIQPSLVTNDEAVDVKIPIFLMPTRNDIDMLPFFQVLKNKFGDNCGHRRFEDMDHGFAGNAGNFSDPLIQERVNEVITTFGAFFHRNLNETNGNKSPNNHPEQLLIITLITFVFVISR